MLAHSWLLVLNIAGVMGRPEQRERKRKQAAASSQRIDSLFAPAAKHTKESSSVSPSTPSTENSQNAIAESELCLILLFVSLMFFFIFPAWVCPSVGFNHLGSPLKLHNDSFYYSYGVLHNII